jgi:hypothetical protein
LNRTSPPEGSIRRDISLTSVDLPDPDKPHDDEDLALVDIKIDPAHRPDKAGLPMASASGCRHGRRGNR